jgi:Transposase, Mutator family
VAKYADNGRAKTKRELATYLCHYYIRDPIAHALKRFANASEMVLRKDFQRSVDRDFAQWRASAVGARCGGRGCRLSRRPRRTQRSKSLEVLIPILYLKGVPTGDFKEALVASLGKDASGLLASTIGRLKEAWSDEHARWSKRDLSARRYVYFWVDGIPRAGQARRGLRGYRDVRRCAHSVAHCTADPPRHRAKRSTFPPRSSAPPGRGSF